MQALIIIDVQNDYFSGGKMELVNPDIALKNINLLEDYFNDKSYPIIYIQHIMNFENAPFFAANSEGANLYKGLKTNKNSIIIQKECPNSFLNTSLKETLDRLNVNTLVITGMMTHMCVDSTTRAAKELGYSALLVHDATATRNLEFNGQVAEANYVQTSFISALQNFATVVSTKDFLDS